jgi:hypothetical protein
MVTGETDPDEASVSVVRFVSGSGDWLGAGVSVGMMPGLAGSSVGMGSVPGVPVASGAGAVPVTSVSAGPVSGAGVVPASVPAVSAGVVSGRGDVAGSPVVPEKPVEEEEESLAEKEPGSDVPEEESCGVSVAVVTPVASVPVSAGGGDVSSVVAAAASSAMAGVMKKRTEKRTARTKRRCAGGKGHFFLHRTDAGW